MAEEAKAAEEKTPLMHISTSPHARYGESVPVIMICVVLALAPSLVASIYFFGINSVKLTVVCILSCLLCEWVVVKFLFKKPSSLADCSALVTGILLAFNLPPDLPLWMAALGGVFAIGVVKLTFGGLGNNFMNPALAGRVFLLASYPAAMTTFSETTQKSIHGLTQTVDAITGATPLAAFKSSILSGNFQALDFQTALPNLIWGNVGGCIGETSVIAILLGALFLWYKRIIGFGIPVFYIGTVFILFWIFNGITTDIFSSDAVIIATYQILSGGLMLGAFFMATDMVTSPITSRGRIIFGIGCGVLTFIIRKFGGYPEGVSFAIILMNLVVPLIDRYIRPKMYGKVKKNG
jgi:electron transport complex protein RnfD